jgi:hypothetical protein
MTINGDERAICKRRGHDAGMSLHLGWTQCKWCGVWLREVRTIEEREDAPPEDEQSPLRQLRRLAGGDPPAEKQ